MTDGACLSGEAAAVNIYHYIELINSLGGNQGLTNDQL